MNQVYSRIFFFIFFLNFLGEIRTAEACNDVTGLNTTSITHTSAILNWDPVVADSFLIRYFIMGTNDVRFKLVSNGGAVSAVVDSLYPNTNYGWLIHTYCSGGLSGPYQLAPAQFTTTNGYVSCLPPNLLKSTNITNTSSHIEWNNFIDADSFLVRYHEAGSANFYWKFVDGIDHSADMNGLNPSTIYEWEVRTICNGAIIPYSYTDTFVTNCDTLPAPDHIVICIMENKGYPQVIDSFTHAPYINALANDPMSALFTQSYALTHPSQPNYLELFSGSAQGITNNNLPAVHFTTPNLARSLLDAGKTFITYSENLPYTGCDTIRSGYYERKHNPVANWMGTGMNQVPDTCNQPYTNFPSDYHLLPTVSFVIPDQFHDMHNTPVDTGDAWLAANMDAYIQWAKTNNSLFILTFDEDNHAYNNRITTIFTGQMVSGGQYSKYMNHHSLLRTIEDMYSLSHAGNSGAVESVRECWLPLTTNSDNDKTSGPDWAVYGHAGTGELNIDFNLIGTSDVGIQIFTIDGKLIHEESLSHQSGGIHRRIINPMQKLSDSIYIVRLRINEHESSKKVMMIY
jgi:acid phosphatase